MKRSPAFHTTEATPVLPHAAHDDAHDTDRVNAEREVEAILRTLDMLWDRAANAQARRGWSRLRNRGRTTA